MQRRSADRKRQRAAAAKGEARTSEEATREKKLRKPLEVDGRKVPVNIDEVKQFIHVLGRYEEYRLRVHRRRLLRLLLARLRQMSPI